MLPSLSTLLYIFMSYPSHEDRLTRSAETDEPRPFNLAEFIVQRLEAVGVSAILLQVPEDSAPRYRPKRKRRSDSRLRHRPTRDACWDQTGW